MTTPSPITRALVALVEKHARPVYVGDPITRAPEWSAAIEALRCEGIAPRLPGHDGTPSAPSRAPRAAPRAERLTYGRQEACACCGQDIEWHGRAVGWIDRGAGRACLPYIVRGEVITPPKKAKHKPAR